MRNYLKIVISFFVIMILFTSCNPAETKFSSVSTSDELNEMLATTGKVLLLSDIEIKEDEMLATEAGGGYVIDLNDHTLKINTSGTYYVPDRAIITIENGRLVLNAGEADPTLSSIGINDSATLILDNVDFTSNVTGIGPNKNSTLIIRNQSTVTANGAYAIATNASLDDSGAVKDGNVTISIDDSTVTAGDGMAICFNVPGNVDIKDSIINGVWTGVLIRGGNATIKGDTKISTTCDFDGGAAYEAEDWGSGNMVPFAALVIGNRTSNSYLYPTVCTVEDSVELSMTYTGTNEETKTYDVYIASSNGKNCDVNVTLPEKYAANVKASGAYHLLNPETDVLVLNGEQITSNPEN